MLKKLVLDIMTWLWENREFQIIETSLRSYLFMAVRNRCLDLISKNQTKRRCYEHMFAEEMQTSFEDPDFLCSGGIDGENRKGRDAIAGVPIV